MKKNNGTYVSRTFHSAVVEACQPEMLVIWSEITNTHFRLEKHAMVPNNKIQTLKEIV